MKSRSFSKKMIDKEKYIKDLKLQVLEIIFRRASKDDSVVFLFGSFAKKDETIFRSSDIDIGIFACNNLSREDIVCIRWDLEEELMTLRTIDFVDFFRVKDQDFIKIALREVEIWHQQGKSKEVFYNLRRQIVD